MKRYLYILLGALLFAACEPTITTEPNADFCFGPVEVTTTTNSATIDMLKPYITVDGVKHDGATIYLEYYVEGNESNKTKVTHYSISESNATHIIFQIDDLEPETRYNAYVCIEDSEYGSASGSPFPIVTKEHTPMCEIKCDAEVEANGFTAYITLSNVEYLVDGVAQEIKSVKLEYARKRTETEWVEVDMTGKESVTLPEEGGVYLDESSTYLYRVTITPANSEFEPKTTNESEFETEYAEVTAEISKPNVAIVGDNIEVEVESVKVWFDGVERPDYHYLDYYVYYREMGGEPYYWENKAEVELTNGGISLSLALSSFDEGKEYEFAGAVVAGAEQKVRLSEVVTITIPKEDTPTPPTPPTPPVGGDADTSDLAGTWHLTQWRGAEPSFDVYLSITEDGVVSLWQSIESREWELFYSNVGYENGIISGVYTDGVAWSASYGVVVDGDTMTWTDVADATDISVYTRSELPAGIPMSQSEVTRSTAERFL